jgi:hypothetical protein
MGANLQYRIKLCLLKMLTKAYYVTSIASGGLPPYSDPFKKPNNLE